MMIILCVGSREQEVLLKSCRRANDEGEGRQDDVQKLGRGEREREGAFERQRATEEAAAVAGKQHPTSHSLSVRGSADERKNLL